MGYRLGIDVGTTYTAAAVCRSSDRGGSEPEVVTLGTRSATVPSVLFVAPDGSVVVGEAAERRAVTDPDRVAREFKRRIGDPTPVVVGGRALAPEDLSARLLRWVVDRVAEREGGPADRIAVTHPASWGQHKKELFGSALAALGLRVTFLAEPQAAALHYAAAERIEPGSTIAVYDLGGGTFDAAVVRKGDASAGAGPAGFSLLGRPEGLERLGGIDFDDAVFRHVLEGMPAAFAELDESDPAVLSAVARIRRECTEAKEALSSDTEVSIPVLLPSSAQGSVRLHRSEFEARIRPQIEDTVAALRGAVVSAGLVPEQLTAVLLVGGSSRIPLVAQLVSEQLGRPVAVDADPKNAIAKGAALAISPMPTPVSQAPTGATVAYAQPPRPARPGPGGALAGGYPRRPAPPARAAVLASAPGGEPAATTVLPPSRPPSAQPDAPDWDVEPEPRRRPAGLAIGLGALAAVVAVVVAVLLWPQGSAEPGLGLDDAPAAVPTSEAAPPATSDSGGNGSNRGGGSAGSGDDGETGGSPSRNPGGNAGRDTPAPPSEQPPTDTGTDPTDEDTGPTSTPATEPTDSSTVPTALPTTSGGGGSASGPVQPGETVPPIPDLPAE